MNGVRPLRRLTISEYGLIVEGLKKGYKREDFRRAFRREGSERSWDSIRAHVAKVKADLKITNPDRCLDKPKVQ